MTTVALFNNKGGVGTTTLAFHLAHMIARLGTRVLAADLDPQANLYVSILRREPARVVLGSRQSGHDSECRGADTPRPRRHRGPTRPGGRGPPLGPSWRDRKSTRLNSSHVKISYAVFCLKKKKT